MTMIKKHLGFQKFGENGEKHQLLDENDEVYICYSKGDRSAKLVGTDVPDSWITKREYPVGSGNFEKIIKIPFQPGSGSAKFKGKQDPPEFFVLGTAGRMASAIYGTTAASDWSPSKVKIVYASCVDAILNKIDAVRQKLASKTLTEEETKRLNEAKETFDAEIIDTSNES